MMAAYATHARTLNHYLNSLPWPYLPTPTPHTHTHTHTQRHTHTHTHTHHDLGALAQARGDDGDLRA